MDRSRFKDVMEGKCSGFFSYSILSMIQGAKSSQRGWGRRF